MDALGIRQADRDEWVGGTGRSVLAGLVTTLKHWGGAEACLLHSIPLCLWGTHPTQDAGVGQVWFLATREAEHHVIAIHRLFGPVMERMQAEYPLLVAYTHPANTLHHKWMRRHGFVYSHTFNSVMDIPYLAFDRVANKQEAYAQCALIRSAPPPRPLR